MTRLLISVRSAAEARLAAGGGANFIDLKEPGQGALGGLPADTIRGIVVALRRHGIDLPISATIGDWAMSQREAIERRVAEVAACGVDIVKVGIVPGRGARDVIAMLASGGQRIVPVFIADDGIDHELVAHALESGFAGVMVDTADKRAGSLFQRVDFASLRRFVLQARIEHTMVGLAGALRIADLPRVAELAPDFAGFRSAVCAGERSGALDAERLEGLVVAMEAAEVMAVAMRR